MSGRVMDLLKHGAVVLVSPDEDLGDGPERLHQQAAVALIDRLVLGQHRVQIPRKKGKRIKVQTF